MQITRQSLYINESSALNSNFPNSAPLPHYSKSQIFVQKFNFDKTPTFSRVFHPNFFLTIFLVKSKLSTAKKSKTTTFSRVFHPKKSTIFSGNHSWFFGQKFDFSNSVLQKSQKCLINHTVRNLHFMSKNSTLISRENCRFFWGEKLVKMLWFWTF